MLDEGVESRSDRVHQIHSNSFQWKSSFSIQRKLRKILLMLDERVENGANGVHRIHWTQRDFSGKVHFSAIRERLGTRKSHSPRSRLIPNSNAYV